MPSQISFQRVHHCSNACLHQTVIVTSHCNIMGCVGSRGVRNESAMFDSSGRNPETTPLLMPGRSQLTIQHERLILELLPFANANEFKEWLQSVYVLGAWREFCRDFPPGKATAREPDKTMTAQLALNAIKYHKDAKFLLHHPDKSGWSKMDHYVRFIVIVIQDNLLRGMWSKDELGGGNLGVPKAMYEVLVYLRATQVARDMKPPRYSEQTS